MELVVDSSVAVKWYVDEQYSSEARRILADYKTRSLTLLAPDLVHAEFGNIMWKKQTFQGFDANDAKMIVSKFCAEKVFLLASTEDLLEDTYPLAIAHKPTVYDMLYLALSLRAGCQFVTADERLVNAIGSAFPNIVWLANWS